jgi:hypothetical protein
MSERQVLEHLNKNIGDLDPNIEKDLFEESLKRVPSEVKTQLSDQWCLNYVLGIFDTHNKNWLIHQNQVLSIDLSDRSYVFKDGLNVIPEQDMQHPIEYLGNHQVVENFLIGNSSKKMQEFIRSLSKSKILEISEKSEFRITPTEVNGILQRAQSLASHFTATP